MRAWLGLLAAIPVLGAVAAVVWPSTAELLGGLVPNLTGAVLVLVWGFDLGRRRQRGARSPQVSIQR